MLILQENLKLARTKPMYLYYNRVHVSFRSNVFKFLMRTIVFTLATSVPAIGIFKLSFPIQTKKITSFLIQNVRERAKKIIDFYIGVQYTNTHTQIRRQSFVRTFIYKVRNFSVA